MLGSRNVVPQKLPTIENCTTDSSSVGSNAWFIQAVTGSSPVYPIYNKLD